MDRETIMKRIAAGDPAFADPRAVAKAVVQVDLPDAPEVYDRFMRYWYPLIEIARWVIFAGSAYNAALIAFNPGPWGARVVNAIWAVGLGFLFLDFSRKNLRPRLLDHGFIPPRTPLFGRLGPREPVVPFDAIVAIVLLLAVNCNVYAISFRNRRGSEFRFNLHPVHAPEGQLAQTVTRRLLRDRVPVEMRMRRR